VLSITYNQVAGYGLSEIPKYDKIKREFLGIDLVGF